ncbi:hypothetical protein ACLI09_16725 [Flavobacterium sp. RHBU_24]|uniref:hypothetical protein n=1 Tax=Flavobacterium sp. RHBU_24 TaxID=3391185 RepID=UPI0039851639
MKMKMKVLVYDNQIGYYKMLVDSLGKDISFILYDTLLPEVKFDVVTFFMGDELEAHDMAKLSNMSLPFILATSKRGLDTPADTKGIYHIDLKRTKDVLLHKITEILALLEIGNDNGKARAVLT